MQFLIDVLGNKNVAFSANEKEKVTKQNRTKKISRTSYKKFDMLVQKI